MDATDLALVEIGLTGIDADDAHAFHVVGPHTGTDQVLEVQVADVTRVVVAGHREYRGLDALGVGDPVLVLLAVALRGEVATDDDDVGMHLVEFCDHAVHQVRHEELRADVRIRDVGDGDHRCGQSSGRREARRDQRKLLEPG